MIPVSAMLTWLVFLPGRRPANGQFRMIAKGIPACKKITLNNYQKSPVSFSLVLFGPWKSRLSLSTGWELR
jgi:hypothetical protein